MQGNKQATTQENGTVVSVMLQAHSHAPFSLLLKEDKNSHGKKYFCGQTNLVLPQFAEYGRTLQDLARAEPFFAPFSFNYLDTSRACTCHTLQRWLATQLVINWGALAS